MTHESNVFGTKYKTKLIGVDKLIWVIVKDFSNGVLQCYKNEIDLPKSARARVDRVYAIE